MPTDLVQPLEAARTSGTQRPDPEDIVLGLDIGGTKLAAGVVRGDGRVMVRRVIPSYRESGPAVMIERLLSLGRQVVDDAAIGWSMVRAVGIACGGPLDADRGIIQSPPNLPGWDDVALRSIVEAAFARPTVVDNDATACALAEWWFGAGRGRGLRNLVYLTISTGIGGGLILNGAVYRGTALNAGELGHLTIDHRGRPCGCGRVGCLEAYASGPSIAARAREALATGEPSTLCDLREIRAEDVAAAALAGDPVAARIWDETTTMLGSALTNVLDVLNPDLIVLGGGVTRAGDQLLRPVRERALRDAMAPAAAVADLVLAGLGEDLGVVSAATIAFERLPSGPQVSMSGAGGAT